MAKLKKIRSGNFTLISNAIFEDWRLSYKEVGLYCNMMMYPDDWDFSVRYLAEKHKDRKAAVKTGIQTLIEYGYIARSDTQHRDDKGYYGKYDYIIYEDPHDNPLYVPCPIQNSESALGTDLTLTDDHESEDGSIHGSDDPLSENRLSENQPTDHPLSENRFTDNQASDDPFADYRQTGDPTADNRLTDFRFADNPPTNNTIRTNTIQTKEEEEEGVYNRAHVDVDLFRKKLTNGYLNTYFTNFGNPDREDQINQAYNAIINALPDIKDPAAVKAINACSPESAGDLLKKVYVEMFSKQLGYVVRSDIVDRHAYLVKFIASQMTAAYGENPLTYYGIRV